MLMAKFWVVKNPTERSTMVDICWETTPNEYARHLVGAGIHASDAKFEKFEQETHAFHTDERTAKCDAEGRLRCRDTIVKVLADHQARIREMR